MSRYRCLKSVLKSVGVREREREREKERERKRERDRERERGEGEEDKVARSAMRAASLIDRNSMTNFPAIFPSTRNRSHREYG